MAGSARRAPLVLPIDTCVYYWRIRAPPRRTRRAAGGGRMDQDAGLVILEDAPLEGMASVVERLGDEDDEAASLALEQHLDQQEVGRAGDRGIMRNLLDQFRGMTQVADLGTHPTKLEWLAFHVPPGGTGQLQLEVTGTQHAAVQLKVMGLGGGSGSTSKRSPTPTSSCCGPARFASPTLPVDLPERIRRAPAGT